MLADTVVSSLLLITYCNQSRDYSVGNVESLVNSDGVGHVRIRPSNTVTTCLRAVCGMETQNRKTTV